MSDEKKVPVSDEKLDDVSGGIWIPCAGSDVPAVGLKKKTDPAFSEASAVSDIRLNPTIPDGSTSGSLI